MNISNYYTPKLSVFQGTFEEILHHIIKIYPDTKFNNNNIKYYDSENTNNYQFITCIKKNNKQDFELLTGYENILTPIPNGYFIKDQIYKVNFNYSEKKIVKII